MSESASVPEPAPPTIYPEAAHFYIPSLDGIRAAAFLLVFFSHAGWENLVPGGLGVTVFFFLSGYLITTLMRREVAKTGRLDVRAFYLRRAVRILPPYYVVLAVTTLITAVAWPNDLRPAVLAAQALQVSNYYAVAYGFDGFFPGFGLTWSLAVEEHFYLLFPAAYVLLARLRSPGRQAAVLLAACVAVMAWRCVLVYGFGADDVRMYIASDTRFDSLLFGCVLAVLRNPVLDPVPGSRPWAGWAAAGTGLVVLVAAQLVRDDLFREAFRCTFQGLALIPLFALAIRQHDRFPFTLLNTRPARFLGVLSYSLYLVHHSILIGVESILPSSQPVRAAVALAAAVTVAYAIHRFVERPCARLRKRLAKAV